MKYGLGVIGFVGLVVGGILIFPEFDRRGFFYYCYLWGEEVPLSAIVPTVIGLDFEGVVDNRH